MIGPGETAVDEESQVAVGVYDFEFHIAEHVLWRRTVEAEYFTFGGVEAHFVGRGPLFEDWEGIEEVWVWRY